MYSFLLFFIRVFDIHYREQRGEYLPKQNSAINFVTILNIFYNVILFISLRTCIEQHSRTLLTFCLQDTGYNDMI